MGLTAKNIVLGRKQCFAIVFGMLMLGSLSTSAQALEKVIDLRRNWKFSIGDNMEWSKSEYDDSHWESIQVPKSWEEQGFHGYDGYAWYRTTAYLPTDVEHATYYLKLGYIDDVDEVYINGYRIGATGSFPPKYSTAYNANRLYMVPHKIDWNKGKLNIAVRVYDESGEGGFIHGDVSIVMDKTSIFTDFDLQGDWKFKTGSCSGIPEEMEYQDWEEIMVPGTWEDQGYKEYDGLACYVHEFELNREFEGDRMVLILGLIDDLDMVYLNGTLIGQSGEFRKETVGMRNDIYKQLRGYFIPPGTLNDQGKNVLVVKVMDTGGMGGIWDGSVGLIRQDNYIEYWRNKRNSIK